MGKRLSVVSVQHLCNLSDEQLERELADRFYFRVLLGTTETIANSTTIWKFRERLAETGSDNDVRAEMQRMLDAMKLKVQKGIMQATFITSDPGHAKADIPRDDEAKTRRSKERSGRRKELNPSSAASCTVSWTGNLVWLDGSRSQAAIVHDGQVDLAEEGEVRSRMYPTEKRYP